MKLSFDLQKRFVEQIYKKVSKMLRTGGDMTKMCAVEVDNMVVTFYPVDMVTAFGRVDGMKVVKHVRGSLV